jgi:Tfp pilus assembly protein PilZ
MFIEADKILPVDTLITLKFKLPDNSAVITGKARVAWTNEPGYSKKYRLPPGMGIQFIEYSQNDMHAVQDYLSKGTLEPTW